MIFLSFLLVLPSFFIWRDWLQIGTFGAEFALAPELGRSKFMLLLSMSKKACFCFWRMSISSNFEELRVYISGYVFNSWVYFGSATLKFVYFELQNTCAIGFKQQSCGDKTSWQFCPSDSFVVAAEQLEIFVRTGDPRSLFDFILCSYLSISDIWGLQ